MNILALDLGTRTGWACAIGNSIVEHGVQVFDLRRGESPGTRFMRFNRWLSEMVEFVGGYRALAGNIHLIAYEQTLVRQSSGMAAEIAHGFATRIQELCAANNIEHAAVPNPTLKAFVLGRAPKRRKKGDPKFDRSKEAMVAAIVAKGWLPRRAASECPWDDNEADAVALLHYAQATWGKA